MPLIDQATRKRVKHPGVMQGEGVRVRELPIDRGLTQPHTRRDLRTNRPVRDFTGAAFGDERVVVRVCLIVVEDCDIERGSHEFHAFRIKGAGTPFDVFETADNTVELGHEGRGGSDRDAHVTSVHHTTDIRVYPQKHTEVRRQCICLLP